MNNPSGLCKCGCGQKTWIATKNDSRYGWVKGQPVDYVKGHALKGRPRSLEHCQKLSRAKKGKPLSSKAYESIVARRRFGPDNPAYNGGLWIEKRSGRCYIRCRNGHPMAYYRAVMEAHLGRPLRHDEQVHHINGDPTDDRLENLQLLPMGRHSSITNKKYTRQELAEQLRDYVRRTGKIPTLKSIYMDEASANPKTFIAHFGTWNNALREAGIV